MKKEEIDQILHVIDDWRNSLIEIKQYNWKLFEKDVRILKNKIKDFFIDQSEICELSGCLCSKWHPMKMVKK